MLPDKLERALGAQADLDRKRQEARQAIECPPVSPHLLRHLRLMFSDPSKEAKPNNPLLGQLLTIQYGCDKVLNYLERQYEAQSQAAREERGI
jgi:hypothetical protein